MTQQAMIEDAPANHDPGDTCMPEDSIAVDLTAVLLKRTICSPASAVTRSVEDDLSARWYVLVGDEGFAEIDVPPEEADVVLLVRTPAAKEPAWHLLFRDILKVDGFAAAPGESAGAILFVRTTGDAEPQFVAWCFGQGSRWIARQAANPRFGLLAALNAMAVSATSDDVGVVGASVAPRDGNLKRASLTTSVPAAADAIPRIDTLADILTAARVRTGHEILGKVSAGRSLQFPDTVASISRFQELSDLVAGLSTRTDYRQSHRWIDDIVPEDDEQVIEAVLDHIWQGADDQGRPVSVEIAWWEDVREAGSDHPATHWRPARERREKHPCRRATLTWPGVRSAIEHYMDQTWQGHQALASDIRFFSDDEAELGRCPAVELLSAEVTLDGTTYALVDGQICRVDADYLAALDRELQHYVVTSRLVPYQPGEPEAAYNKRAAKTTGMLILDTTDIRPSGATQIEPCDLLGLDGTLCHVKRYSGATGISHLANQGVTSATALLRRPESRDKLCALIQQGTWDPADKQHVQEELDRMATTPYRLPVVLAIVGEWQHPTVKSLSLLARMALRTAIQRLSDLGFRTELMLIDKHDPSPAADPAAA